MTPFPTEGDTLHGRNTEADGLLAKRNKGVEPALSFPVVHAACSLVLDDLKLDTIVSRAHRGLTPYVVGSTAQILCLLKSGEFLLACGRILILP